MKSFLKDGDETTASNPTSFPQPPSDSKNLAPWLCIVWAYEILNILEYD